MEVVPDPRWNHICLKERTDFFCSLLLPTFYTIIHPPIRSLQLGVILGLMHIQFANPIFTSNDLRPAQLSLYCQCCGMTVSLCICASNWLFQNNHSSQKVAVGQQHPSLIVPAAVKCPVFLCSFTFRVVSNKSTCLSKKIQSETTE